MNFVFDFDGTLVDTNKIKKSALRKSLELHEIDSKLSLSLDTYLEDFFNRSGLSRLHKLSHDFGHILTAVEISSISDSYTSQLGLDLQGVRFEHHVRDALLKFKSLGDCYILSGGELHEIFLILNNSQLTTAFKGVICVTDSKVPFLKALNTDCSAVFFGDSIIDYEASMSSSVPFVRVKEYSDLLDCHDTNCTEIYSINDYLDASAI